MKKFGACSHNQNDDNEEEDKRRTRTRTVGNMEKKAGRGNHQSEEQEILGASVSRTRWIFC